MSARTGSEPDIGATCIVMASGTKRDLGGMPLVSPSHARNPSDLTFIADDGPAHSSYFEAQTQDDAAASPCSAKTGSEPYFPQMPPTSSKQPSTPSDSHLQQREPASSSQAKTETESLIGELPFTTMRKSNATQRFLGD